MITKINNININRLIEILLKDIENDRRQELERMGIAVITADGSYKIFNEVIDDAMNRIGKPKLHGIYDGEKIIWTNL